MASAEGDPPPPFDGEDGRDEVLTMLLGGEGIEAIAARVAAIAAAALPGHRIVLAARSGAARVLGRNLDLPRRTMLALDSVASSSGPGPTGDPRAVTAADPATSPWAACVDELAAVGLGSPLLVHLVDSSVPLGVLAAFPPLAAGGEGSGPAVLAGTAPHELRSGTSTAAARTLERWAGVAAIALARDADRARVRGSAERDDVTGLPNRALMLNRLREALHGRPPRGVALIHVGLDRLDDMADGLTGTAGDAVLRVAGQRIRAVVRPGDVVGHFRRPTFAVICEGVGPAEAAEVGERIREELSGQVGGGELGVAIRPGVGVVAASDIDTVNSLIHKAAMAARESLRLGGAEVVRYRPGTYEAAVARIDIERDLRRAIDDDGLHLVYQPQVSLSDGRMVGAEALVRWNDSARGAISPDEFIPIAEDSGLVVDLGAWAVDTALAAIAADLPGLVVSVNVSARQLDQPGLVEATAAALDRHGVDPRWLRLEITESALVRDAPRSTALLHGLHDLGVRVSIDDFGTGYATLEHLRRVDVADSLKIDRSFVAGIVHDARDRAIVGAAITLGRSLDFTVVAEGVEDADQAELLAGMGCDAGQGFYFGEPVPATELAGRVGASTPPSGPS